MRKETSTNPDPQIRRIPPREADREARERMRELDKVDADFGDEFYEGMHDRIMARIEKTQIDQSITDTNDSRRRHQAAKGDITLVPTGL